MKVSLTKGLDKEAAQDVRATFLSSLPFRKACIKNINSKIEAKRKRICSEGIHNEQGDFALKAADNMGYERAQREFIELLSEKTLK